MSALGRSLLVLAGGYAAVFAAFVVGIVGGVAIGPGSTGMLLALLVTGVGIVGSIFAVYRGLRWAGTASGTRTLALIAYIVGAALVSVMLAIGCAVAFDK